MSVKAAPKMLIKFTPGVGVVDWAAVEGCHSSFGVQVDQSGLESCHPLVRKDWIKWIDNLLCWLQFIALLDL